jgi:uncharacterized protein YqgV (UPF0045/DUF77 family)
VSVPVPPAELSAQYTIAGPPAAEEAARTAAAASGIAHEAGPGETLLAGSRGAVLAALGEAVVAALDAGAHRIDARLEAPSETRSHTA